MATGTVKWFNATKGFGFIQPGTGRTSWPISAPQSKRPARASRRSEGLLGARPEQAVRPDLGRAVAGAVVAS